MRQLALHLFTARSLYMFRVSSHPSLGVHKTVTTASGTGHIIGAATLFQRDQVGQRPHWNEEAAQTFFILGFFPARGCMFVFPRTTLLNISVPQQCLAAMDFNSGLRKD